MPGRPVIAAAETLPGWYGKLPGLGDFAARRLDKAMVGVWDGWLQDGLQALRQQPGWLDAYLQSPVWCFALGAGVLGPQRWLGVMILGHALLEKLVDPRKPITAHVYQPQAAIDSVASLDAWLAQELQPEHLVTKPFVPLPVLGIPGWWPGNENFSFYDDSFVFRSAPRKNKHIMGAAAL